MQCYCARGVPGCRTAGRLPDGGVLGCGESGLLALWYANAVPGLAGLYKSIRCGS